MTVDTYPDLTPRTIWNFRQNHPELVVRDLRDYLGLDEAACAFVRRVLLARGVNKWLKVRRDLIAYKKQLKHELKATDAERLASKGTPRYRELTERLKLLQRVRGDLKALCMTDRWQVWPHDRPIGDGLRSMNTLRASDS